MIGKIRKTIRTLFKILKLFFTEAYLTSTSMRAILKYLTSKLINLIILKYNILQVRKRITQVKDYKEWESYARLLDHLEGNNEWKCRLESRSYDYARIERRRQMMKQLRKSDNVKTLTHCLRQDLVKNIGNISTPALYSQCHFGTKKNVEKYMEEVTRCIKTIYQAD